MQRYGKDQIVYFKTQTALDEMGSVFEQRYSWPTTTSQSEIKLNLILKYMKHLQVMLL